MLTQLDVSHNTKLIFIETFDNQLTSFDCTMLKDLEFLHIDYNKLTTLDMSQNPNLQGNGFVVANNQLDYLIMPNIPGKNIEASVFYEQNSKQGYENIKWYYDSSYSQEVKKTDMIPANGQKLYVKWIANPYTVYYNANGGQGNIPSQSVEYDQTFNLTPNTFTRTGYTFQNWNTYSNAVGGRTFSDGQEVVNLAGKTSNKDRITLYAQWKPNTYTIRYDANGGEGSMNDTEAVYDKPVQLSAGDFTKSNYVLAGWSLNPGEQNSKDYLPEQTVQNLTSVDKDTVTLYAVWLSYGEIQSEYQNWLSDFFSTYSEADYYQEDWTSLDSIKQTASEAILNAGADVSAMQQALQTAFSSAEQIKNKEQRTQEIVQSWESAHSEILSQLTLYVSMDKLEEYQLKAQLAIADSEAAWLEQQSTLTDPTSIQAAVSAAQDIIEADVQHLHHMQNAIVWLGSVKDTYQSPMGSVKSTDVELYSNHISEYEALSSEERVYCDYAVLNQLIIRKDFAQEKQNALQRLDTYFASIELSDYTEENQQKLADIMDEAKLDIENADTIGMADRLLLESIDNLEKVEQIIRQKAPVIEVKPTASAITKGQKLSESRLTGGKAETQGTFSWKDGSIVPTQTGEYTVVFTPNDSKLYLPVEFTVTVSVLDPKPEIPSEPDNKPDENTPDTETPSNPDNKPNVTPTPEVPSTPDANPDDKPAVESPSAPQTKPDMAPTPQSPSSPNTAPDSEISGESIAVNGSAQTSDNLSQSEQSTNEDKADNENQQDTSEPSKSESDTDLNSNSKPDENTENTQDKENDNMNVGFVLTVSFIISAAVVGIAALLIVKFKKKNSID